MAFRFTDSFGHYATANFLQKYDTKTNTPVISAAVVRDGVAAFQVNDTDRVEKTLDAQATWVVGFPFWTSAFPASNATIFSLLDGSSYQVRLALMSDGKLELRRGGTATTIGTAVTGGASTLALSADTWYFIEFKVTIADSISANTCQINVDGDQWVNVATGQDMKETGNATADRIQLGVTGGFSYPPTSYYNSIHVLDGTGSENNDFLGDVIVEALLPDGNGATSDFLGSDGNSVNNHELVDEVTPDGDTTYVESGTATDRDLYTLDDLASTPESGGIHAVVAHASVTKTDAGTRTGKITLRSGSTNYDGDEFFPSNGSYNYKTFVWEQDPDTAAAWTESGFNAVQAGVLNFS